MFEMIMLPYDMSALEPYMPERTMEFHYGKHYKNYIDTLNKLTAGTEYEGMTLEEIVRAAYGKADKQAVFNNAGQALNHQIFWTSMKPNGGGRPQGKFLELVEKQYGSFEKFREELKNAAVTQFGSGWAWVALDKDGSIKIVKTANADNPLTQGLKPLVAIDVWEHAYYLDFQNRRADFVDGFLDNLVNWPQM